MKTFLFFIGFIAWIYSDPLKWKYSCKKMNDSTYIVHFTAILHEGWHAYSQVQPKNAVAIPTAIKFSSNPLINLAHALND
jgi:thiol:disulfide interchange protein DsbD